MGILDFLNTSNFELKVDDTTIEKIIVSDSAYPILTNRFEKQVAKYISLNMQDGPWLAGGAVRKLFTNETIGRSDYDIWCSSETQKLKIAKLLNSATGSVYKSDKATSFSFFTKDKQRYDIQLINEVFETPEDLLNSFDFTICQCLTDGNTYKFGENTLKDINSKTIRLVTEPRATLIPRIIKYTMYGFHISPEILELLKDSNQNIQWIGQNGY